MTNDSSTQDEEFSQPMVTQIMRTDVPSIGPETSVGLAASTLVRHGVPGVAVVENGKLIGIVTEADLISREADVDVPTVVPFLDAIFVADAGPSFEEEIRRVTAINARQLMTSPVISVRSSATLTEVATLMVDRKINPVPVLDDSNTVIGIVSRADLVRIIAELENQD